MPALTSPPVQAEEEPGDFTSLGSFSRLEQFPYAPIVLHLASFSSASVSYRLSGELDGLLHSVKSIESMNIPPTVRVSDTLVDTLAVVKLKVAFSCFAGE